MVNASSFMLNAAGHAAAFDLPKRKRSLLQAVTVCKSMAAAWDGAAQGVPLEDPDRSIVVVL